MSAVLSARPSLPVFPDKRTCKRLLARLKRATFGLMQCNKNPYSITSSARASSMGGSCRPSCFAAFWLTTSSNSVGA